MNKNESRSTKNTIKAAMWVAAGYIECAICFVIAIISFMTGHFAMDIISATFAIVVGAVTVYTHHCFDQFADPEVEIMKWR